jgi:energy-coupling factor transport system ATP-binding protein
MGWTGKSGRLAQAVQLTVQAREMLLSIRDLSFTYPDTGKPALSGISLDIGENEYVAILGANGSGKSTLARCIAGLLTIGDGSILIDAPFSPERVPVALVFQSPGDQIVAETVDLDIAFGPENLGLPPAEMNSRVEAALSTFKLKSLAGAPTHSLTSGQKQHLALAGVYALSPAVLLLDEPTSMLSPLARGSILAYLDRFHAEGGTILHITHDLAEAERADRIIVLDDGVLVHDSPPQRFTSLPEKKLLAWGLAGSVPQGDTAGASGVALPPPVLECQHLDFGPFSNFGITIRKGSITAITGESGSGKTVLLEILAGLRLPECGVLTRAEDATVALAVQESESSLFAEFVADDVAFGPRNAGLSGKPLVARVSSAMDLAGLPYKEFANRRTFSLSGGERRKAALAGIIAMDTSVILLDEPSSALDTGSRCQLLSLILELKKMGKTVVFTTNRAEECDIADAVINLADPDPERIANVDAFRGCRDKKKLSRDQQSLARLRAGAGGSYRKLDTPIHRLPPLYKYILAACGATAALAIRGWPFLCGFILVECISVVLARYPFRRLAGGILKILPWFVLLGVLQYLLVPGNLQSLDLVLRFIALYIPLSVFVYSTAHTEIMYGMEDILSPLRVLGVPVRDGSLVTGIVFHFLTLLYEEAARITTARIIRGAGSGKKKGLFATVSSMASLFVPLVVRTLTRAERLAQAIEARYYGAAKNSRYLHWKTGNAQRILILSIPVLTGILIYVSYMIRI